MGLFSTLKNFDREFTRDTIAKLLEYIMRRGTVQTDLLTQKETSISFTKVHSR